MGVISRRGGYGQMKTFPPYTLLFIGVTVTARLVTFTISVTTWMTGVSRGGHCHACLTDGTLAWTRAGTAGSSALGTPSIESVVATGTMFQTGFLRGVVHVATSAFGAGIQ